MRVSCVPEDSPLRRGGGSLALVAWRVSHVMRYDVTFMLVHVMSHGKALHFDHSMPYDTLPYCTDPTMLHYGCTTIMMIDAVSIS